MYDMIYDMMYGPFLDVLIFLAAVGSGLIAGVFFAFSTFVMKALARLPYGQGITAMQSINTTVLNVWFAGLFFGTTLICIFLGITALVHLQNPQGTALLIGSLLYLLGAFAVTLRFNVPLNNALAAVEPDRSTAASHWAYYAQRWSRWNHIRTLAALGALTSFIWALA